MVINTAILQDVVFVSAG